MVYYIKVYYVCVYIYILIYHIILHFSSSFPIFPTSPVPSPGAPLGTACCRKVLCSASRNFPRRPKAALRLLKPTVSCAQGQSRLRSPMAEIT